MGPRKPEYVPSHPKMYPLGSARSLQGMIRIPIIPVITAPVLKLMSLGTVFEKSFAGDTVLAAMFTDKDATTRPTSARTRVMGLLNLPRSTAGSQMASPNTIADADVMMTPNAENTSMVGGRPMACPIICSFWPLPNRVKSGMFRDNVAQNPTIAVREGINILKYSPKDLNLLGAERRGPNPFAAVIIQITRARPRMMTKGAAQFSKIRTASMPRRMM